MSRRLTSSDVDVTILSMSTPTEPEPVWTFEVEGPDISAIVIEDDEPLDNLFSEKQQRLLTEPLYSSWSGPRGEDGQPRTFLATANVGVFATAHDPPLVPDVLLAADVSVHPDAAREKKHQTYFLWEIGKPPDVVVEIVSNAKGGELGRRKRGYEKMGVAHFVVWDPEKYLRERELMAYAISPVGYIPMTNAEFARFPGLSLRPWEGAYEGLQARWLRWFEGDAPIPTGAERAEAEHQRAEAEHQRAEAERQRADRLAALLAAHGLTEEL